MNPSTAPLHDEREQHFAGTFLDLKHFRVLWLYLIARGRQGLADELFYNAKVFDDYVYVFHGPELTAAIANLRKELPKFFVRGFWVGFCAGSAPEPGAYRTVSPDFRVG